MMPIKKAKNIGKVSAGWLHEIHVESVEDLEHIGAVRAYMAIRALRPKQVSLNLLWALEGALTGQHWLKISKKRKAQLKRLVQ